MSTDAFFPDLPEAKVASTPREAALVYPANYWYSLIEPPKASEFPGSGAEGNGINTKGVKAGLLRFQIRPNPFRTNALVSSITLAV